MYVVDPLDVKNIPHARTHLIIGKRNTGKTTLLINLLYHRQQFLQFGIVIAGSIGSVVELRKACPDTFIFEAFDTDVLEEFWKQVKRVNGRLRRRNLPMVNFYIILDDTGFDARMWGDKTLKAIMMNGRQYNLDVYICMQYIKGLDPSMREQVDYCYIFKTKSPENQKRIYDAFAGGMFESKYVFENVLKACTIDRRAMVVRNSDISNEDEQGAFDGGILFYKGRKIDDLPQFYIGCDQMWRYHFQRYNEHYESDEEDGEAMDAKASSNLIALDPAPKRGQKMKVALRRKKVEKKSKKNA
jgi:hypothetical protein